MAIESEDLPQLAQNRAGYCTHCHDITVSGEVPLRAIGKKCPECLGEGVIGIKVAIDDGYLEGEIHS